MATFVCWCFCGDMRCIDHVPTGRAENALAIQRVFCDRQAKLADTHPESYSRRRVRLLLCSSARSLLCVAGSCCCSFKNGAQCDRTLERRWSHCRWCWSRASHSFLRVCASKADASILGYPGCSKAYPCSCWRGSTVCHQYVLCTPWHCTLS